MFGNLVGERVVLVSPTSKKKLLGKVVVYNDDHDPETYGVRLDDGEYAVWDTRLVLPDPMSAEPAGVESRRKKLLDEALQATTGRGEEYGGPEDSFTTIAQYWEVYKGVEFKPHDVAVMMMFVKLARLQTNPQHYDSWVDIAGYAACGFDVSGSEVGS